MSVSDTIEGGGGQYWPFQLPAPEAVTLALEMIEAGVPAKAITRQTRITPERQVEMRREPWRWDVHIDPVAMARAQAGDRTVLPRLTWYERRALLDWLCERYEREPPDPDARKNVGAVTALDWWMPDLAALWGVDPGRLWKSVNRRVNRLRREAA